MRALPDRRRQEEVEVPPTASSVAELREGWREFARVNPMFYIAVDRRDWSKDDFFASGRGLVEDVLAWAGDDLPRRRMLEIGCGMGRMLMHFAPHFERVDGIDIAPEMIEQAKASGLPDNVHVAVSSGADLAGFGDDELDFVFSFVVFQHIPDARVVASYLSEVRRVLQPRGKAALQFDTRPKTLLSRLVFSLPDFMLPPTRRRYIRRYRLGHNELLDMVGRAGLRVDDERDPGSDLNFLLLRPPGEPA